MKNNKEPYKLKPVTFISGRYNYYHGKDRLREMMLLKAMRVTSDPKVLMQMTGMKKFAELTRTWDKISNRREYNTALEDLGMDFKWIAKGLKVEAESADKSADRINALKIILKSVGLDTYQDAPADTGSWEDMILKASENKQDALPAPSEEIEEYEVIQPKTPEGMKEMRERENIQGKSIYEQKPRTS